MTLILARAPSRPAARRSTPDRGASEEGRSLSSEIRLARGRIRQGCNGIRLTSPRSRDQNSPRAHPPPPPTLLAEATCCPSGRAPHLPSMSRAYHCKEHRQCAPSAHRFTLSLHCSTRVLDALAGTRRGRHEAEYHLGHAREAGGRLQDDRKPLLRMWQRLLVVQPIVRVDFLMPLRSVDVSEHAAAVARRALAPSAGSAEGNLRICDCISAARSRSRSCSCF